jgi:hypothetical protein
MELVGNEHIDELIAADATGSSSFAFGALHNMRVDLFQADITPTRVTALSDYTAGIADYNGYGHETATFGVPSRADDGTIEVLGTVPEFRPSDALAPNTIFGLWTTLGDGSLGFAARFDNPPIPMQDALDQITVTLRYRPTNGGLVDAIT